MELSSPSAGSDLPAPTDPRPRWQQLELQVGGDRVRVRDDHYSDRLRCDHPATSDGRALGRLLRAEAEARGRGRVVVLCRTGMVPGLVEEGFFEEACMPGYYLGQADCHVLGAWPDPARALLGDAATVAEVDAIWRARVPGGSAPATAHTARALVSDAEAIADLIGQTFDHYPTPSGVPAYVAAQIEDGTPFRIVRRQDQVVACASADLVRQARTAELTDCATLPSQRGRGLMRAILHDLMLDLQAMGYPTAYTLARAVNPGVNIAFGRLGFLWRGRMRQSCRIGGGLEDMNVWSRFLDEA